MNSQFAASGKNLSFLTGRQVHAAHLQAVSRYAALPTAIPAVKRSGTVLAADKAYNDAYLQSETMYNLLDPPAISITASNEAYSDGAGI